MSKMQNENDRLEKVREELNTILFTATECDAQYMANALDAIAESSKRAILLLQECSQKENQKCAKCWKK